MTADTVQRQREDPEAHTARVRKSRLNTGGQGVRTLNRQHVTVVVTEAQLLAALEFPRAFFAEGPQLRDGGGWL